MIVQSEDDLNEWQRQWANFHVLLAMTQLGLFDLLEDGQPRTAEALAEQLGADVRAIDICARILVRAGLLHYEDGAFCISSIASKLKTPIRELKWEWRRRHNFANLLETIRTGRPAMVTSGGVVEADERDTRQFLQMSHRRSATGVQEAIKVVRQTWDEIKSARGESNVAPRILDLGGGHGRYAATFAAELPGAQVTLFDRELVTRIARELSGNDFQTRSGDFLVDDLGGPYDLVFMAYIVSGIAIEDVRSLFSQLRAVVVPGGAVVVEDMFVKLTMLQPAFAIDFNLILLLENERGRFRTVDEIAAIMSQTGFPRQQHVEVSKQDFGFMIGR